MELIVGCFNVFRKWADVASLSDEEPSAFTKSMPPTEPIGISKRAIAKGGRKQRLDLLQKPKFSVKSLRRKVASGCGCKCNCFEPFRKHLFDKLAHMRGKMASLPKLQCDEYVGTSFS